MSRKIRKTNRKAKIVAPTDVRTERRRVTVKQDHKLDYPELWATVYVAGDRFEEAAFAEMLARSRCYRAKTPETADVVIFTGGADVNPFLYGEKAHKSTRFDVMRDLNDIALYKMCFDQGIPMFGVCRGAQFLHVMNGGKLFQDVNNHYGDHRIWDYKSKSSIERVSSVHHQMVRARDDDKMEVIARATKSDVRWLNDTDKEEGHIDDIEAFFYRDTCCIGVQGHPEYSGYGAFTQWCLQLISEYIILNPDLNWENNTRRVKPEYIAMRDIKIPEVAEEILAKETT